MTIISLGHRSPIHIEISNDKEGRLDVVRVFTNFDDASRAIAIVKTMVDCSSSLFLARKEYIGSRSRSAINDAPVLTHEYTFIKNSFDNESESF